MRTLRRLAPLALFAALTLTSCATLSPERRALSAAEARWKARTPAAYEMRYSVICFCGPDTRGPWNVTVEDGRVTRVAGDVATARVPDSPLTVERLFDEIRAAHDNPQASVTATYDPTDGHPVQVNIDRVKGAVDDEVAYAVERVVRLR